jgi:outer membrane protein OmpA-like peptidoglycan-associated protein
MLVGHTDAVGTDSYNEDLSLRRSRAAASYLSSQGVARGRLLTSGRGEMEPIASNDDESGRSRNRRVEIAIYANDRMKDEARREAGGD